jgi:hypothetical protein
MIAGEGQVAAPRRRGPGRPKKNEEVIDQRALSLGPALGELLEPEGAARMLEAAARLPPGLSRQEAGRLLGAARKGVGRLSLTPQDQQKLLADVEGLVSSRSGG